MNKKIIGISVVLLVIIILIVVNSSSNSKSSEVIKIGLIAPLTGSRADAGEFSKNGASLALEKINNDPERKYKLEFVIEDSKYEPQTAVGAFRKMTSIDNIKYVIGTAGSSEVLAVAPLAESQKVLYIATGAQSDDISSLGDYIFRLIHHTSQEAPIFAKFVAEKMKNDTLHFLAYNTAITDPYIKGLKPVLEGNGKKIGLVEKFDTKATEFRTELTKIKSLNPTDILLIATPKLEGMIIKQAKEMGFKNVQFYSIGVEGPELLKEAGDAANGLYYPYSYDKASADTEVKSFYDKYLVRFGTDPDTIASNSYDAVMILGNCVEKVSDNVDLVKSCLYSVKDYEGASGKFSIDENGDAVKQIFIKTVKNGKFVRLGE